MRLDITKYTTGTDILYALTEIARDFQALRDERDRLYNALTDAEWLDDGYSKVDELIDYDYRFKKLMAQSRFYSIALEVIEL